MESEIKIETMDLSYGEDPPIRVRMPQRTPTNSPTLAAEPTSSNGYPVIPARDIDKRVLDIHCSTRPTTPRPMSPEYVPTHLEDDNPWAEIPKGSRLRYFAPQVNATTPRDIHLPGVVSNNFHLPDGEDAQVRPPKENE